MKTRRPGWRVLLVVLSMAWISTARGGHSVLIWPVDPVIPNDRQATELWVENRGTNTTLLQVRIFAWRQSDGRDEYATQHAIASSPAMIRLDAGQKQMIRLIKQSAPAAGQEQAYRVLLDEIPTPFDQPDDPTHSLSFQMRYSIPLFIYGQQASAGGGAPELSWRAVKVNGASFLEITNRGPVHARLSKTQLGKERLTEGLYGYVLAHASHRWPLTASVAPGAQLQANVDNRNIIWRSAATVR